MSPEDEWRYYEAGETIVFDDLPGTSMRVPQAGWYFPVSTSHSVTLLKASKPTFWQRLRHKITRKPWPTPSMVISQRRDADD